MTTHETVWFDAPWRLVCTPLPGSPRRPSVAPPGAATRARATRSRPRAGPDRPDDRDGAAPRAGRHPAASRPPGHTDAPATAPGTGPPPAGSGPPRCRERPGLAALATAADAELAEHRIDGALIRVAPDGTLSWRSLHGAHPLQVLVGFVAPPEWAAIGVSNAGWAHPLDATGRPRRRPDAPSVQVTVLFSRSGVAAGVLRKGAVVSELPDPPEGVVADACRRALVLPTAPPPATTAELWALTWLDRIVEVAARAGGPAQLAAWPAVAALHPAAGPPPHPPDPSALAAAAVALAEAWPWSRLRSEPSVVEVPGAGQPADLAAWMDDGMWARWLLAGLPGWTDALAAVHALLSPAMAIAVTDTVGLS